MDWSSIVAALLRNERPDGSAGTGYRGGLVKLAVAFAFLAFFFSALDRTADLTGRSGKPVAFGISQDGETR